MGFELEVALRTVRGQLNNLPVATESDFAGIRKAPSPAREISCRCFGAPDPDIRLQVPTTLNWASGSGSDSSHRVDLLHGHRSPPCFYRAVSPPTGGTETIHLTHCGPCQTEATSTSSVTSPARHPPSLSKPSKRLSRTISLGHPSLFLVLQRLSQLRYLAARCSGRTPTKSSPPFRSRSGMPSTCASPCTRKRRTRTREGCLQEAWT